MNKTLGLYHDVYCETENPEQDLVLIHGWGMNSLIWDLIIPLLQNRFRVTVIDLPGFGQSPIPGGAYDLEYMAKHVLDVAPDRALWVGWSLGGLVTMKAFSLAPERIVGMMFVAASPKFIVELGQQSGSQVELTTSCDWVGISKGDFEHFAVWLEEDWQGSLIRFLALQCKGSQSQKNDIRFLKERVFLHGLPAQQALREGLKILIETDFRETLKSVTVPFEFMLGSNDEVVPSGVSSLLMELYPSCVVHDIKGASHIPMVSHAWECVHLISQLAIKT